jgi:hypothetical protein
VSLNSKDLGARKNVERKALNSYWCVARIYSILQEVSKNSDWKNLAAKEKIVLATGKILLHESKRSRSGSNPDLFGSESDPN